MMTLRQFLAPLPSPSKPVDRHTTRKEVPAAKRPGMYSIVTPATELTMQEITREVECYPGLSAEKKIAGK